MPIETPPKRSSAETAPRFTPALAKAKIGMIAKATQGFSPCSAATSTVSDRPCRATCGTKSAVTTPPSVAWTPDFSRNTQTTAPTMM